MIKWYHTAKNVQTGLSCRSYKIISCTYALQFKEKKKKKKINKGQKHRLKWKSIYISWIFWKHFCFHEVELYFKSLHMVPFFYKLAEIAMFHQSFIISYSPIQTANIKGKYYINVFTLFFSLQIWVSSKCLNLPSKERI